MAFDLNELFISMLRNGPVASRFGRWQAGLHYPALQLFGQPLTLRFETSYPGTEPIPCCEETDLATSVVNLLPSLLPWVETVLRETLSVESFSLQAIARQSHILIDRHTLIEAGPARWALVVKSGDPFDPGWQLDFDASTLLHLSERGELCTAATR